MLNRSLLSTSRIGKQVTFLPGRFLHKGVEGAPPMRYVSPTSHIIRYLILSIGAMSLPTYVMYNYDNYRPRPETDLSSEMQELIEERMARRKEGKQPVLQDWPIIHQNKKVASE